MPPNTYLFQIPTYYPTTPFYFKEAATRIIFASGTDELATPFDYKYNSVLIGRGCDQKRRDSDISDQKER
jgi:hypothetical protein